MEHFISRKRRKVEVAEQGDDLNMKRYGQVDDVQEDESTDYKLASLASLYPHLGQDLLIEALISSAGSVEATCGWLGSLSSLAPSAKPPSITRIADRQSSLSSYTVTSSVTDPPVVRQSGPLTKKGQTLHLYTPEDIARHTPCSIIHNFLGNTEADHLLKELLEEAPTFEKQTFKLFDNVVQSPHSACFYVESLEEQKRQRTEYLYNGSYLTVGVTLLTQDERRGLGL